jgi:Mrp family chromosome partitioning ATPase/uncharacterized protein involved in exopolysaccharide biosynthesis
MLDPIKTNLPARIWRRRDLFALVFAGVFIIATIAAYSITPIYSASGAVIVGDATAISNATPAAWIQKLGDPADLESQLLIIRSPRMQRIALSRPGVLDAVLRECSLREGRGLLSILFGRRDRCSKLEAGSEDLLNYVETRYVINAVGRSRVIAIAYQSSLPEVSFIMANALVLAYLEDYSTEKLSGREATSLWLLRKMQKLDRQLGELNEQIVSGAKKRTKNGVAVWLDNLRAIRQQLAVAEAKEDQAAARIAEIGLEDDDALRAIPAIADLKQRLLAISAKTSVSLSPGEREALTRRKGEIEAGIKTAIQGAAEQAKQAQLEAHAQVKAVRAQLEALEREVNVAGNTHPDMAAKVRAIEAERDFYLELFRRSGDLESERRVPSSKAQLVNLAEIPTLAMFPKRTPMLAAAMVAALVIAFAAALGRDLADNTVWNGRRLEALTGAPDLGKIPSVAPLARQRLSSFPTNLRARLSLLAPPRPKLELADALLTAERSELAREAIADLYARLMLGSDQPNQSFLVTSAGPAEGKSFTAVALAKHVAGMGRKVLLVDCNLRHPSVAAALECPNGPGLIEVLSGAIEPQAAVNHGPIPDLHVICAAPISSGATQFFMGGHLTKISRLARDYSLVLIDGPPVNAGLDASFIVKHVDGAICCARWRHAVEADTRTAIETLREANAKSVGIVVTIVEEAASGFSSGG